MDCFRIVMRRSADGEFHAAPFPFRRQLNQRIMSLRDEPRPADAELISEEEKYSLQVHGWRIVYEIDDDRRLVTISAVVKD
jgi:mRNA-degrading endonuclease RelE of RelBE toxin-antitoxin system